MKLKKVPERDRLLEMIEREEEYLKAQTVGSDEYVDSQERLRGLVEDYNRVQGDNKDRNLRRTDIYIKAGLMAGCSIAAFVFEKQGHIFSSLIGREISKKWFPKF